ncbi:hypothetical protein ZOSMA_434G00040 [Zostera marina]|uniref:Solute carrier family 40 member n=1 Tax=Zostera marina TaxID=29655 RepID=A0A0K9P1S1_ZOSMR|nr:hypothetical protein ZOSMA_434G00040 [Zostera marina]
MWEFSVGLYMINIWPDSLLFAAVYGVVESASTVIFGPIVGKLVDRLTYLHVFLCRCEVSVPKARPKDFVAMVAKHPAKGRPKKVTVK